MSWGFCLVQFETEELCGETRGRGPGTNTAVVLGQNFPCLFSSLYPKYSYKVKLIFVPSFAWFRSVSTRSNLKGADKVPRQSLLVCTFSRVSQENLFMLSSISSHPPPLPRSENFWAAMITARSADSGGRSEFCEYSLRPSFKVLSPGLPCHRQVLRHRRREILHFRVMALFFWTFTYFPLTNELYKLVLKSSVCKHLFYLFFFSCRCFEHWKRVVDISFDLSNATT